MFWCLNLASLQPWTKSQMFTTNPAFPWWVLRQQIRIILLARCHIARRCRLESQLPCKCLIILRDSWVRAPYYVMFELVLSGSQICTLYSPHATCLAQCSQHRPGKQTRSFYNYFPLQSFQKSLRSMKAISALDRWWILARSPSITGCVLWQSRRKGGSWK